MPGVAIGFVSFVLVFGKFVEKLGRKCNTGSINEDAVLKAKQEKPHSKKRTVLVVFIVSAAIMLTIGLFATWLWYSYTHSYAADEAKLFEKSLVEAGAVKRCSNSSSGKELGSGGNPWYYAVFEIPGDKSHAKEVLYAAASQNGFKLNEEAPNLRGDEKFADRTNKPSRYEALEPGPTTLLIDLFSGSVHNGRATEFCGVNEDVNAPTDRATILFTINLPRFK